MKGGAAVALAVVAAVAPTPSRGAPAEVVGVVPLVGEVDGTSRARATEHLITALGGLEGLEVVALSGLDALLGPGQAAALSACGLDEACVRTRVARVRTDRLLLGALDPEGNLRLRLVASATTAPGSRVLVSRQVPLDEPGLQAGLTAAALELFPERADQAFGRLVLQGGLPDAAAWLDGAPAGALSLEAPPRLALRVRAGRHAVRVLAPGHAVFEAEVEVPVGQRVVLEVRLSKNRSAGPLYLAGGAVVLAGVATALGVAVNARASGWEGACPPGGACEAGYTRARFEADTDFVEGGRTATNALWGVAGTALVGAALWYFMDPGEEAP